MKKFLDILLIFMLSFLFFSLFFNNNKEKVSDNTLEISFEKQKYTVPPTIKILVQNHTNTGVTLNTCNDISILKSGEKMIFPENVCKDIQVEPSKIGVIDFGEEYKSFDKVGKYTLEANIGDKKYLDQFELKNKGIIAKTFIGLIYTPIYNIVVGLMILFKGSLGWAIIGITIILKLVLLWPQHKMMVSQRKIQEIQPKIKKLQEQYKGDQQKLGQELMALYSKEKINPMGSCGFLLIQMPILLVVYNIIRGIQRPANEYYIYSFFNDFSLSQINFDFFGLDLLGEKGIQGLILAICVAGVQFIQVKISLAGKPKEETKGVVLEKKENAKDYSSMMPDAEMMNKFMLFGMPVMVGIFTYSWFAAIGLYWGVSTLFTLIQNLIVNRKFNK